MRANDPFRQMHHIPSVLIGSILAMDESLVVTCAFGSNILAVERLHAGTLVVGVSIQTSVYRCALSPNNRHIAVAAQSPSKVLIIDIQLATTTEEMIGFSGVPCSVLFSLDGDVLIVGDNDGLTSSLRSSLTSCRGYHLDRNVNMESKVHKKGAPTSTRFCFFLSFCGSTEQAYMVSHSVLLAPSCARHPAIRLFYCGILMMVSFVFVCTPDTAGAVLGRFIGHTSYVYSVAFLSENTIGSAGNDKRLLVWNCGTFSEPFLIATGHHDGAVYALDVHPSLEYLATGCEDRRICVWRTDSLDDPPMTTMLCPDRVDALKFTWSLEDLLVAAVKGHVTHCFDFMTGTLVRKMETAFPPGRYSFGCAVSVPMRGVSCSSCRVLTKQTNRPLRHLSRPLDRQDAPQNVR